MQQDGKLIGVISHVPALKERIGTQLAVTPEAGGIDIIGFVLGVSGGFFLFPDSGFKGCNLFVALFVFLEAFQFFLKGDNHGFNTFRFLSMRLHVLAGLRAARGKIDGPGIRAFTLHCAALRQQSGKAGEGFALIIFIIFPTSDEACRQCAVIQYLSVFTEAKMRQCHGGFLADFNVGQIVVPDFPRGFTFREKQQIGFDARACLRENATGQARGSSASCLASSTPTGKARGMSPA